MTSAPRQSPFAAIPVTDFVRDGAALVLLLVSLAMPWTVYAFATDRIEVILITLLSVFSLAITWLARAGVFPPTVTVNTVWLLRLLVNLPYVVLVAVYIVIDLVNGSSLGTAAVFGLAGALLAAQPREAETRAFVAGAPIGEVWYRITVGFGAVAVLTSLGGIVVSLVALGSTWRYGFGAAPVVIVYYVLLLLVTFAIIVLLYGTIARRSEVGRTVALSVGTAVLVAVLIDLFTRFVITGGTMSVNSGGYTVLFVGALAGLAFAPPVRIAMLPVEPLRRWFGSARTVLLVQAGLGAFSALGIILVLVATGGSGVGLSIGSIVCTVAIAVLGVVGRTLLAANPVGNRLLVVMLGGLTLLVGIVYVALLANLNGNSVDILSLVLAFGLPAAVLCYLTVPAPVRALVPAAAPAAPTVAPTVDVSRIALALDPATPAETLYQLATEDPSLRQYIAANPSTYGDLLNWLSELGDPAVDAALRAR